MSIEHHEHEPIEVTGARCAHCRRPLKNSVHSIIRGAGPGVETRTDYCGDRAACRRACSEQYGDKLPVTGGSTEALGAALIAGDYVQWPWWSHLLTNRARDQLRYRFAKAMSAAVEHETRRRAATTDPADDDPEDAGR